MAPEGRKVGLNKAAGAEQFGQLRDEKHMSKSNAKKRQARNTVGNCNAEKARTVEARSTRLGQLYKAHWVRSNCWI